MSRSNPFKKKRRAASKTLLVYGEGLGEEMFLKHLKRLYAYGSNTAVTIRNGRGGDAASIVINADNEPGGFNKKVVVLDNDKRPEEMNRARQEAQTRGIELFENNPCLEAMLLVVLNGGQSYKTKGSGWCKNQFQSQHIGKKKRSDTREYERVFPKSLLDAKRSQVAELDTLISLITGNF